MDVATYLSTFSDRVSEYPKNRDECIRVRDSMIVHTRGVYPKKLLEIKRPNEGKKEKDYRLATYREITKEGINNAIDSIYRTLINSNGDIIPSSNISEYLLSKKFTLFEGSGKKYSFKDLWFQYYLKLLFDDANGYFGFFPVNSENPLDSPSANPPTQKIELIAMWVDCDRVLFANDDFICFRAKYTVKVQVDVRTKRDEAYYFVVTDKEILRIIPYWDGKKINYRKDIYYTLAIEDSDKFPSYPLRVMGGTINLTQEEIEYYESYLYAYVPYGDECICSFSDNQVVRARYNFPVPEVKGQVCADCKGTGKVRDKDGKLIVCGKCKGNTVSVPFTPFGEFLNMPPASGENTDYALHPAVLYHNPDVSILQHSWDAWMNFRDMAKEAVNKLFQREPQSGVAKEIDREEKYDMLYKLSQAVFSHIKWSLEIIEAYREPFAKNRKQSIVTPPTSFQLLTEGEMMTEMTDLINKDAPGVYINEVAINLSKKVFNGNDTAQKIIQVLTIWDILFGKTAIQISQARAAGGIDQTDLIRHNKGYQILIMLSQDAAFAEKKIEDIILDAEAQLQKTLPNQVPIFDNSGIQNNGPSNLIGSQDVSIGKLPLALQQLGLALNRAREANNIPLATLLENKMKELVAAIQI